MMGPSQLIRSTSLSGIPEWCSILMNCSITTDTLVSTFKVGLLPMNNDPISYKLAISKGKLKGAIIPTGPKGHLKPLLYWPK